MVTEPSPTPTPSPTTTTTTSDMKSEAGEAVPDPPDEQPVAACPSSPAYSDISDANEESEEQGAESADEMVTDLTVPPVATKQTSAVPVAVSSMVTTTTTTTPDSFSSFAYCPNFRGRDESSESLRSDPLSFPYPYSYPAAFSLPASPAAVQPECGDGVCATMETTGPPPAPTHPTSSYFLHPLSFPHVPVFRMFPSDKPVPDPALPPAPVPAATGQSGQSPPVPAQPPPPPDVPDPPTQRHLHTHHHTHVGVPFPSYHPIAAFPLLSNPAPRAGTK